MIAKFLFSLCFYSTYSLENCGSIGDCISGPMECNDKCGCEKFYSYNESIDQCVVNMKTLLLSLLETSNLEEKIRGEAEKVFRGITISAFIFISCAAICVFAAGFYCCRISYKDQQLKKSIPAKDIKLVTKKLPKVPVKPSAQSCNVMIEDAGVFVV